MRKQTLLKSWLLLFALIVGNGSAWAVDKWVKTAPSDLQTGDIVVIVDQTSSKAMSNNNGTSSAPSATAVTLSTDKSEISSEVAAALQWEVTKDGSSFQFGVSTSYLYVTNNNNGVRVGSGARNTFTIVSGGDNGGYYLYNDDDDDTRYVGCYNKADWRCYGTINSNIKGNNTAFYKKTAASGAVDPSVTISTTTIAVGATATINGPSDLSINYSSNNTSVATVDNDGVVTGVAAGTAKITASWDAVTDTYNAGSKEFTVEVVSATVFEKVTSNDQLVAGNEYIIVAPNYNKAMGAQGNNIRECVDVTVSENTVSITNEEIAVLTLGGELNAWTFLSSDNDEYLAYSGSSNQIHSNADATADASKWIITTDFQLESANVSGRFLRYNAGSPRFACYTGGQQDAVLFVKKGGAVNTKADAELAFTETLVDVNIGEGDNFVAPTLTTATGFDGTVAYSYVSSNEENIVELDETTGEIQIEANAEGTITVTATSAETDNFKAGNASYTINIVDNREEAGLEWSASEVEIEQDATEFTLPTLSNPNNVTVSYTSSNEDIALVDAASGEVVVETSEVGTAIITAEFAGNASYKPASVSYTIKIKKASGAPEGALFWESVSGHDTDTGDGQSTISIDDEGLDSDNWASFSSVNSGRGGCLKISSGKKAGQAVTGNIALTGDGILTFKVKQYSSSEAGTLNISVTGATASGDVSVSGTADWVEKTVNLTDGNGQVAITFDGVAGSRIYLDDILVVEAAATVPATVTSYKWATFSSEYDLDFTNVTALEAHIVTGANGSTIVTEKVGGTVAAGTGLLLYSETPVKNVEIPVAEEAGVNYSNMNKLIAVTEDNTTINKAERGFTNYVLTVRGEKAVFAYIDGVPATLNKGKAYLNLNIVEGVTPAPFLGFDGEGTTGINSVERGALSVEGCYTLDGRRVAQPTKGLYIVNGKKVMVK